MLYGKHALALALGAALCSGPALAGEITLTIEGVEPRGGNLLVSLQTEDQFMSQTYVGGAMLDGDTQGAVTTVLEDVPPGDYAISVLHDADRNMTMTMKAGGEGIEEGWGMSGEPPTDRVPAFADARFTVPEDGAAVTLAMMYPD